MAQTNASSPNVTVGCKLPHGIVIRRFKPVERHEPVMGGGTRKVTIHEPFGEPITINGNAHPQNAAPRAPIAHGFALTYGVPRAVWDDWYAANEHSDMVVNGLIFAHGETASVQDQAKDHEKQRTGLERIDPQNLPPQFRRIQPEKTAA